MSLLFIESFDHYAIGDITEKWTEGAANQSIVEGAGRCDTAAYRNTSSNAGPFIGVTNSSSSGVVGIAYNPEGFHASDIIEIGDLERDVFIFLRVLGDGSIDAWRGPNTVLGAQLCQSAAGLVSLGIYSYIELAFTIDNSAGSVEIFHNGISVASASSVDTIPPQIGIVTFDTPWRSVHIAPRGYLDDVYVLNGSGDSPWNGPLGDVHVDVRMPVTDSVQVGTYQEWTPSSGSDHGAMVDEIPPDGDTTTVSSDTAGALDSYAIPQLLLTSGTVYGVQILVNVRKDNEVGTREVATTVRSDGADFVGDSQAVSISYRYFRQVYQEDPATSDAWTISGVNNFEPGIKLVS